MRIGIAGAGVLGRLLAWRLAAAAHDVHVFDPAAGPEAPATGRIDAPARHAAGFTAAGMLSPCAELEGGGREIARLGWRSIALWRDFAEPLGHAAHAPLFTQRGSLLVAHGSDWGAAQRVLARIYDASRAAPPAHRPQALDAAALAALEPALSPSLHAWWLPAEAQLLPRETLSALHTAAAAAHWHWGVKVDRVEPGALHTGSGQTRRFDLAIDTRGLGARDAWPLRGVRGEIAWLHAPGLRLARPLRLLHARHRVYLVPRPGDIVVVGASEIEAEDRSPVSLKSAVELLAAAHSVLPELAEARLVHLEANLRPALPDHLPRRHVEPGLLRINGLFRHGWLLAPALVEDALAEVFTTPAPPPVPLTTEELHER